MKITYYDRVKGEQVEIDLPHVAAISVSIPKQCMRPPVSAIVTLNNISINGGDLPVGITKVADFDKLKDL